MSFLSSLTRANSQTSVIDKGDVVSNSVIITTATVEMVTDLVQLSQTLGYQTSASKVQDRVQRIIDRPDHCLLVATVDGEVAGFCHAYIRLLVEVDTAVEIGGLVVKEKYQGQGIGKQLVTGVEAWARQKKLSRIVLSSNILREKAHQFYEHLGYRKIKQQFAFEKVL